MSQENIIVDNLLNPMPISSAGLATYPSNVPGLNGVYTFSITDVPGVVAANNFLTLVNPVASGKTVIILGLFISTYIASGSSSARNSLQGGQATAVSGGTLAVASAISKFKSSMANPVAELRTGNPAATIGANIFNSPPPITTTSSQFVHSVGYGASTAGGAYTIAPGEGVCLHTAAGATAQTWNISINWGEF